MKSVDIERIKNVLISYGFKIKGEANNMLYVNIPYLSKDDMLYKSRPSCKPDDLLLSLNGMFIIQPDLNEKGKQGIVLLLDMDNTLMISSENDEAYSRYLSCIDFVEHNIPGSAKYDITIDKGDEVARLSGMKVKQLPIDEVSDEMLSNWIAEMIIITRLGYVMILENMGYNKVIP